MMQFYSVWKYKYPIMERLKYKTIHGRAQHWCDIYLWVEINRSETEESSILSVMLMSVLKNILSK